MPYRRKRNVRRRKTRNVRRYKKRNYKTVQSKMFKQPQGLADRVMTKLIYAQRVSFNTTGNLVDVYKFRGNSVFDPDLTGAGVQPVYFDNYAALYRAYRVFGSKISCQLCSGAGGPQDLVMFPTMDQSSVSASDTMADMRAQKWACHRIMVPFGQTVPMIKCYGSTARVTGNSKVRVGSDDLFQSDVTGNPTRDWTWCIGVQPTDQSSVVSIVLDIKIVYYVSFFGRLFQNLS